MSDFNLSDIASIDSVDGPDWENDFLANWQTTAALGVTIASGGVAGAIMLAAFPAQTLAAGATIGGLAYAGKRRADGLSPLPDFPFLKKDESESTDAVAPAQPVAAPAAA